MTPREGEVCTLCGYPVAERGVLICAQCGEFQMPARAAESAVQFASECNGCRNCGSSAVELRRKEASNGTPMFGFQCLSCGRAASNWIKRSAIDAPDSLPAWDAKLPDALARQRAVRRADEFATERSRRKAEYDAYLMTPKWRAIRSRVMNRSGGLCEGCGVMPATQVHHLTYENVGDELLFQLVAVCDGCYDRVHQSRVAA